MHSTEAAQAHEVTHRLAVAAAQGYLALNLGDLFDFYAAEMWACYRRGDLVAARAARDAGREVWAEMVEQGLVDDEPQLAA